MFSAVNGYPKISYLTDNTQHIVFTSIEPSLVFTYDTMIGVHSIWRVRKARTDVSIKYYTTHCIYQTLHNTLYLSNITQHIVFTKHYTTHCIY